MTWHVIILLVSNDVFRNQFRISALGLVLQLKFFLECQGGVLLSFSVLYDHGSKLTTKTLHFRRLFSVMLVTCMSIRIKEKYKMVAVLSQISLSSPGTVAHQAPVSMGFPRQEYWSGLSLSHSALSDSQQRYGPKQAGFLPFTITRTCSNSCPLSL